MATRETVFPANPHALFEQHGYSPAIRSGSLLFVSGQVGAREDGSPEPDLKKQVHLAFENLRKILEAAGCSFEDVMDVTTFHIDAEASLPHLIEAKQKAFPQKPYPNLTAVGVTWLAGFQFEIKVIARIPGA
ncbi:RidA family protein [Stigmatella aurantiaca]|uniref:Endoribonuclease L-PSP family protein n=1 Tax=Stigmatella aurantiaca (strain DW4/3-1) TaxID=378806 RepID=Q09DP8_STIAD|nr:RidA family protein [Stigmatella aurantiaca]ADO75269.1 Endoribonuclease L-PSP family protein [Stigmatella aurantiaca DW4/3-1]EAU69920.1 endoribonuclease L-PSP family protein [Stigmatella aurantiaca DW4/3-1]